MLACLAILKFENPQRKQTCFTLSKIEIIIFYFLQCSAQCLLPSEFLVFDFLKDQSPPPSLSPLSLFSPHPYYEIPSIVITVSLFGPPRILTMKPLPWSLLDRAGSCKPLVFYFFAFSFQTGRELKGYRYSIRKKSYRNKKATPYTVCTYCIRIQRTSS